MTTIPPPSALAPAVPTTGGSTVTAVLTQLPPSLQSAGPGTIVTGTVVSVDSQGQVVLQTNAGLVSVQSAASVAVGERVSLQIQAMGGGQAQAIVLGVEAAATAELAAAAAAVADPSAAGQAAAAPAATIAPSVATGSVVIATVIGPGTAAPSPTPAVATPAPGSPTPPQQTPASNGSKAPSSPAPAAAQPALPATTPASPQSAPGPAGATAPQPAETPPAAPRATVTAPASLPASSADAPPPAPGANGPPAPGAAQSQAPASVPAATEPDNITPAAPDAPTASPPAAAPTAADTAAPSSPGLPAAAADPSARPMAMAAARYAASLPPTGADDAPNMSAPPASTSTPLPMPPAGTQIPLRFVGALPTLAAAAASASSGQLVATVVAVTPAGQVVVDTAIGRLALNASLLIENPTGSQIAFEVAAPAMRPGTAASAGTFAAATSRGLAGLTTDWPALKTVLTTLADIDPRLAQQIVETALPQPDNPRFLSQVLALINAPPDDVKMLLGQLAAETLQQAGRSDVMAGLNADLRQMARLNAAPSDWRVFYVPLFDSTEARQLRVFTRRRRSGSDPRRDTGGRFVVEVEFEELGPLQLDGLVQKPRLDLILRTHAELPAVLQTGISNVFSQTCDAAGLQGKIFFQAIPAFPVSPLDEMMSSSASGLTV